MGGINTDLNNALTGMGNSSKVILGIVLGGMMAIDMGGPFNKAAYVFGTAAIAAGNYDIMAAVMIGGMTPPCAIALATLLFKDKSTKEERDADPTNFIMGLALSQKVRFHSKHLTPFVYSFLYRRICGGRSDFHGIRLYTDGTTRWNFRIPCGWKRSYVPGRTGCGTSNFCSSAWPVKEESSISTEIRKAITKN